ncbi:hypothetical protein Hypma_015902 [Hypsizygus marmoreus]|uniref:ZZ-type domain-containing protein n=1 Tax=Hypsizygus marmoreus TaxID=39966 RepID=A0A369K5H7_HYPMA|nr:hypothetical protein Hypma_015902 [Hypsizygus marmoreus]
MFSVKATYRGEIRKFSFDTQSFPTFDQLYNQLHRVFPSSHNYYLSKLLFCPDASQSARILMAQEVHNADDYARCLLPYKGRSWSNALLRFSVYDETPHKTPSNFSGDTSLNSFPESSWSAGGSYPVPGLGANIPSLAESDATPRPISSFYIPPPPIVFSTPPRAYSHGPMDVDPVLVDVSVPNQASYTLYSQPRSAPLPPSQLKPNSSACCSVGESKAEIQVLLHKFQQDLDRILNRTFGRSSDTTPTNATEPTPPPPVTTPLVNPYLPFQSTPSSHCSACANALIGYWYVCANCSALVCSDCYLHGKNDYRNRCLCPVSLGSHLLNPASPAPPLQPLSLPSWPPTRSIYPPWTASMPSLPTCHNNQAYTFRYGASSPPVEPFIPPLRVPSPVSSPERSFNVSTIRSQHPGRPVTPPPPPPPPIIHQGVICDMCEATIEGIRHKCLDCPDYDLCTPCISSQSFGHNPHHKFLDLAEPTRIVVHAVYDEGGTRHDTVSNSRGPAQDLTPTSDLSVFHEATCDLCDSTIRGDRYKCTACPDFDTCSSCFTITKEQHPRHSFVRISHPSAFIRRDPRPPCIHLARCDACGQRIHGVRYKCLHRDCPDVDLCERCEGLPIPQHPDNHPLLKMKTPDTAIPTVYRTPAAPVSPRGRIHTWGLTRSPSFEHGYMHNPASQSMWRRTRSRSQSPSLADPSLYRFGRSPSPAAPGVGWSHPLGEYPFDSRPYLPYAYQATMAPTDYPPLGSPINRPVSRQRSVSPPLESNIPPAMPYALNPGYLSGWALPGNNTAPTRDTVNTPPTMQYPYQNMGLFGPRSPSPSRSIVELRTPSPAEIDHDIPGHFPISHSHDLAGSVSHTQDTPPAESGPWFDFHRSLNSLMQHVLDQPSPPTEDPSSQELGQQCALTESTVMGSPLDNEALLQRPSVSDSPQMAETTIDLSSQHEALLSGTSITPPQADQGTMESPLQNEALLNRAPSPDSRDIRSATQKCIPSDRSLSDVLSDYCSISIPHSEAAEEPESIKPVASAGLIQEPLSAEFIEDVSSSKGQIFLLGERFIKIWRMLNNGSRDWPESTTVVFVGGTRMMSEEQAQSEVVGSLKPGEEKHVWSGELKAPETPGKFTSYWRLRDDKGQLFGDTIWADIEVIEPGRRSADEHLSSSSIIVMPDMSSQAAAPAVPSEDGVTPASTVLTDMSDDGVSDSSSVSLVSMPSSDEEDDPTLWADSRAQATAEYVTQAMEYVMLYDDNTSSEEE